ncbi:hypothetical protein MEO40_26085, partial [Dolichospermum sp. ST_sed1]|nr:hypothetical protein [Dolichospermum sp. ST_sed1]
FGPTKPLEKRIGDNLKLLEEEGFYQIEDSNCQSNSGLETINQFYIHNWDGNGYQTNAVANETKLSSKRFLHSPAIKKVVNQLETIDNCTYDNTTKKETCEEKPQVISQSSNVVICKDDFQYSRTSVEAVALTTARYVDQTWQYYQSLSGSNKNLPQVELNIFPKVGEFYKDLPVEIFNFDEITVYTTDNLAFRPYPPEGNNKYIPTFYAFPTGSNTLLSDTKTFNAHLWESEFILSHEFGHFVLFEHSNINSHINMASAHVKKDIKEFRHGSQKLKNISLEQLGIKSSTSEIADRKVDFITHWGAINEGYADLFAYYGNKLTPGLLNGLECLQKTREVTSHDFFKIEHKKTFSLENYDKFVSTTASVPLKHCEAGVDLQAIHSFGAIIAYGVNLIFSNSQYAQDSSHIKLGELLLKWGNSIGELIKKEVVLDENLTDVTVLSMLKEAVKVASNNGEGKVLTQAQCDALENNMSHLWDNIKNNYTCELPAGLVVVTE